MNSSGDPVEAAEILDTAENHIVALKQIVERVPEIVTALQSKLPDQLEDLESGYRKLLESGYHFTETDIESRFQQLHASLKNNMANVSALNWTMLFTKMNKFKKKSMLCITSLPVKLNHKSCEEVSETTAWLFETCKR